MAFNIARNVIDDRYYISHSRVWRAYILFLSQIHHQKSLQAEGYITYVACNNLFGVTGLLVDSLQIER